MSMNLNASVKNGTIELWQLPTQISYTIMPPSIPCNGKGIKAKEALLRYMEYVKGSLNGKYETAEQLKQANEYVNDHLRYIEQFLNDKTLRVWVM